MLFIAKELSFKTVSEVLTWKLWILEPQIRYDSKNCLWIRLFKEHHSRWSLRFISSNRFQKFQWNLVNHQANFVNSSAEHHLEHLHLWKLYSLSTTRRLPLRCSKSTCILQFSIHRSQAFCHSVWVTLWKSVKFTLWIEPPLLTLKFESNTHTHT